MTQPESLLGLLLAASPLVVVAAISDAQAGGAPPPAASTTLVEPCRLQFDSVRSAAQAAAAAIASKPVPAPGTSPSPAEEVDSILIAASRERPDDWKMLSIADGKALADRIAAHATSAAQAAAHVTGTEKEKALDKVKLITSLGTCLRSTATANELYSQAGKALQDAEREANLAQYARTVDDAKAAATRARDAANRAKEIVGRDTTADRTLADFGDRAVSAADSAALWAARKESWSKSLCGISSKGNPLVVCGVFGLFAATLSRVQPTASDGAAGRSQKKLASIAVPFIAARVVPLPETAGYFSLDLGLYSAFITKSLTPTSPDATRTSCSSTGGDFESHLPCEANSELYPYAAAYLGLSFGRAGLGFITVAPYTIGLAQVGTSRELRKFSGYMLGVLQVNGSF